MSYAEKGWLNAFRHARPSFDGFVIQPEIPLYFFLMKHFINFLTHESRVRYGRLI